MYSKKLNNLLYHLFVMMNNNTDTHLKDIVQELRVLNRHLAHIAKYYEKENRNIYLAEQMVNSLFDGEEIKIGSTGEIK